MDASGSVWRATVRGRAGRLERSGMGIPTATASKLSGLENRPVTRDCRTAMPKCLHHACRCAGGGIRAAITYADERTSARARRQKASRPYCGMRMLSRATARESPLDVEVLSFAVFKTCSFAAPLLGRRTARVKESTRVDRTVGLASSALAPRSFVLPRATATAYSPATIRETSGAGRRHLWLEPAIQRRSDTGTPTSTKATT